MQVLILVLTISERGRYDKLLGLEIRNQGELFNCVLFYCIKSFKNLRKGVLL